MRDMGLKADNIYTVGMRSLHNVLYRVHFAIIHGECWLSKPFRKFSSFNSTRKW